MESSKIKISWDELAREDVRPGGGGSPTVNRVGAGNKSRLDKYWIGAAALGIILAILGGVMWNSHAQKESQQAREKEYRQAMEKKYRQAREKEYRQAMEKVLEADSSTKRRWRKENVSSDDLNQLHKELKRVDLSGCPKDFTNAYHAYLNAVGKIAPFVQRQEERNSFGAFADSFLSAFVKGMFWRFDLVFEDIEADLAACEQLDAEGKRLEQNMQERYGDILRIAEGHGVNVSRFKE